MIGLRFNRLTVCAGVEKHGKRYTALCVCDCGSQKRIDVHKLQSGHTKSCGCLQKELMRNKQTTHGTYYEPEYRAWSNMHKRCSDPRWSKWYGDIKVCERWLDYKNFLTDVGRKPTPAHTLDRVDSTKSYEPGNVRWASRTIQSRNTKNHETNSTGVRGVSWSQSKHRWRSAIYVDGKQKHLGYFTSIEDAAATRSAAEATYWTALHDKQDLSTIALEALK